MYSKADTCRWNQSSTNTNSTGDILEGEGSICMEEGKRNQGLCMKYKRWFSMLDCIHGTLKRYEGVGGEFWDNLVQYGCEHEWIDATSPYSLQRQIPFPLSHSLRRGHKRVVQTALPNHYQGSRCELTAQTSFHSWEREK